MCSCGCSCQASASGAKGVGSIKGAIVAIVTPFKDGKLDEEAYKSLIEWQIASGTHGIVPCGTTGESATLSHEEHKRVVELAVKTVAGRVPVIAGTGSNSTSETIELTHHAKAAGADAALVITPYYNKPTQEGLYQHFMKVADECKFPMILYNVPGRTALNMLPATVARCAQHEFVVGIKEATGNLSQISEVIKACPSDFILLSGDDFTAMPTMAVGGRGVISVASNVAPAQMAQMMDACLEGKWDAAKQMHYRLFDLFNAMFYETNPAPAKTSLELMGKIPSGELRLPLCSMSSANKDKLAGVLRSTGILQ